MSMEATALVERNAHVLDQHFGNDDWVDRISLLKLNMASFTNCVLGQLFGLFGHGVAALIHYSDFDGEAFIGSHIAWTKLILARRKARRKAAAEVQPTDALAA